MRGSGGASGPAIVAGGGRPGAGPGSPPTAATSRNGPDCARSHSSRREATGGSPTRPGRCRFHVPGLEGERAAGCRRPPPPRRGPGRARRSSARRRRATAARAAPGSGSGANAASKERPAAASRASAGVLSASPPPPKPSASTSTTPRAGGGGAADGKSPHDGPDDERRARHREGGAAAHWRRHHRPASRGSGLELRRRNSRPGPAHWATISARTASGATSTFGAKRSLAA